MGLTFLAVEIASPARPTKVRALEFLVDSGAVYSVVPADVLASLGIKPIASQEFRLADGSKIVRKKGSALFRLEDRVGTSDVVFGEQGDSTLLGALSLEAMGFVLDPLRRELKPMPMLL